MKITLYYYVVSGGDGSAYPIFFSSKEARDKYQHFEEEVNNRFEGFCDADGEVTVGFDVDNCEISLPNGVQDNRLHDLDPSNPDYDPNDWRLKDY